MRTLSWILPVFVLSGCTLENTWPGSTPDPYSARWEPASDLARQQSDWRAPAEGAALAGKCGLDADGAAQVTSLADITGQALHECIACGGAQVRVARSLIAAVFLSNKSAFDMTPETQKQLDGYAVMFGMDLAAGSIGHDRGWWHLMMPAPGQGGMAFDVAFVDPASDATMTANVFDLNAYLAGCTVTSSLTLAQMMADMDATCVYTFTYDHEGPLGDLLHWPREPLPNPIVVKASLDDFVSLLLGKPKVGAFAPFNRLTDVLMDSHGSLVKQVDDTTVQFDLSTARTPIVQLVKTGMAMHLGGMVAQAGPWQLRGQAGELTYLKQGCLAGALRHMMRRDGGGPELELVHDFGEGMSYPQALWSCATR